MEVVVEPSIDAKVNVAMVSVSKPCWMDLIIGFLAEDRVLANGKANRVRQVAARYWLSANRKLYRKSFGGPYLQCWGTFIGPPSNKLGILVATNAQGCCQICPKI